MRKVPAQLIIVSLCCNLFDKTLVHNRIFLKSQTLNFSYFFLQNTPEIRYKSQLLQTNLQQYVMLII